MTTYRAGVIGLGRMGWLYDASLPYPPSVQDEDGTPTELAAPARSLRHPADGASGQGGPAHELCRGAAPAPADGASGRLRSERETAGGVWPTPRGQRALYRLPGVS